MPFRSFLRSAWACGVGPRVTASLIRTLARLGSLDLLEFAHEERGIGILADEGVHGEEHFIQHILPGILQSDCPVCFDVGAHHGSFSKLLRCHLPHASVYAFEAHPKNFAHLERELEGQNISLFPFGLGSKAGQSTIFDYPERDTVHAPMQDASTHASLYPEVFHTFHAEHAPHPTQIEMRTLDDFCTCAHIAHIDFLKIDVEGHEWEVLSGAKELLAKDAIHIIQFEVNEMNVISRVFLRDFYLLLPKFSFFRITPQTLIPLGPYQAKNEIFRYQNIVAMGTQSPHRLAE